MKSENSDASWAIYFNTYGKNKYWEIYMTECSTFRYVQNLLKTRSTVFVQFDQWSWKKYRTFQNYSVESPRKFWVRKMYNFYESFQKINLKDCIFLKFKLKFWIQTDRARSALVHENFKASQWNFYGLSKEIRKKNYFRKLSFLYILFYWILLQIVLYTISLHIAENNILPL